MPQGFTFVGDRLCLDFVNTQVIDRGRAVDLLGGFDDLVTWCVRAQVIDGAQAEQMIRRWSGTRDAARAFGRALALRAALRGMVEWLGTGRKRVPRRITDIINDVLRARAGDLQLVHTQSGYDARFRPRLREPAHLLVPIAESAADLLSRDDLARVRKCQNPACILFFYDTTKNRARRWCSMAGCGNRAKAAAHYRRARRGAQSR